MAKQTKPSIVFAHGLWADGSCFQKLIPTLQADGHEVMCSQHGLDSLKSDVECVTRCFGRVSAPVVLVGHSYGGTLITHAGTDNRVAALVYIAALAPDETETSQSQQQKFPATEVFSHIEVADGRIWLKPDGIGYFAGDLPEAEQKGCLGNPSRARARPVQPKGRGCRLAVEAELVHCGRRRSHRPPRVGTLRRKAHGRHNRRVALQSRPDALPAACCARRDPHRREGRDIVAARSLITLSRSSHRRMAQPS
jgi:pimeloyl-ACP methyl ester carboxylesterase